MGIPRDEEIMNEYYVTVRLERTFHFDYTEPLSEDDMRESSIDMFMDVIRKDSDTIDREEVEVVRVEQD